MTYKDSMSGLLGALYTITAQHPPARSLAVGQSDDGSLTGASAQETVWHTGQIVRLRTHVITAVARIIETALPPQIEHDGSDAGDPWAGVRAWQTELAEHRRSGVLPVPTAEDWTVSRGDLVTVWQDAAAAAVAAVERDLPDLGALTVGGRWALIRDAQLIARALDVDDQTWHDFTTALGDARVDVEAARTRWRPDTDSAAAWSKVRHAPDGTHLDTRIDHGGGLPSRPVEGGIAQAIITGIEQMTVKLREVPTVNAARNTATALGQLCVHLHKQYTDAGNHAAATRWGERARDYVAVAGELEQLRTLDGARDATAPAQAVMLSVTSLRDLTPEQDRHLAIAVERAGARVADVVTAGVRTVSYAAPTGEVALAKKAVRGIRRAYRRYETLTPARAKALDAVLERVAHPTIAGDEEPRVVLDEYLRTLPAMGDAFSLTGDSPAAPNPPPAPPVQVRAMAEAGHRSQVEELAASQGWNLTVHESVDGQFIAIAIAADTADDGRRKITTLARHLPEDTLVWPDENRPVAAVTVTADGTQREYVVEGANTATRRARELGPASSVASVAEAQPAAPHSAMRVGEDPAAGRIVTARMNKNLNVSDTYVIIDGPGDTGLRVFAVTGGYGAYPGSDGKIAGELIASAQPAVVTRDEVQRCADATEVRVAHEARALNGHAPFAVDDSPPLHVTGTMAVRDLARSLNAADSLNLIAAARELSTTMNDLAGAARAKAFAIHTRAQVPGAHTLTLEHHSGQWNASLVKDAAGNPLGAAGTPEGEILRAITSEYGPWPARTGRQSWYTSGTADTLEVDLEISANIDLEHIPDAGLPAVQLHAQAATPGVERLPAPEATFDGSARRIIAAMNANPAAAAYVTEAITGHALTRTPAAEHTDVDWMQTRAYIQLAATAAIPAPDTPEGQDAYTRLAHVEGLTTAALTSDDGDREADLDVDRDAYARDAAIDAEMEDRGPGISGPL